MEILLPPGINTQIFTDTENFIRICLGYGVNLSSFFARKNFLVQKELLLADFGKKHVTYK